MNKIYVKDVLKFGPCPEWTEERLKYYDPENQGLTPLEICDLDIPRKEDILRLLLRPEIISERDLHELACVFAERALNRERREGREPDPASWAAIEGKRKWLRGEISDEDLMTIRKKAVAAAYAAYADDAAAAYDAAYAAYAAADAYAAAAAAAYDAAYAASAAADADAYAAYAEERKEQLKIVKNLLEKKWKQHM